MAPQTPLSGVIQYELSQTTGASSNAPLADTQQQCRHQLVHRDAAIAATNNTALDTHLKWWTKQDAAIIGPSMRSDVSSFISM